MTMPNQPAASGAAKADDALAISNLIAESHFLVDTGRWGELADEVFALEAPGVVPEAVFALARRLSRLGPDVALGRLPAFLSGLGTSNA